jgi:hypothetical protein
MPNALFRRNGFATTERYSYRDNRLVWVNLSELQTGMVRIGFPEFERFSSFDFYFFGEVIKRLTKAAGSVRVHFTP